MKLYQKLTSLLVAAVMAAVLMPVCMAAPGDSVETRINNALAQRTGAELYQEIVTTAPDGTTQTMIAARSNGNAYIKMDMGDAGSLVYILKDGQGYLVDDASKMAVKGEVPTVSISEAVSADERRSTGDPLHRDHRECERSGLRGPVLHCHRCQRSDGHRFLLPGRR